jgi:hypothetical protein
VPALSIEVFASKISEINRLIGEIQELYLHPEDLNSLLQDPAGMPHYGNVLGQQDAIEYHGAVVRTVRYRTFMGCRLAGSPTIQPGEVFVLLRDRVPTGRGFRLFQYELPPLQARVSAKTLWEHLRTNEL